MTLMVQLEDAPVAAPEHTSRHRAPFLHPGSPAPALVEHGRVTTHDELARRVADLADRMPPAATGRRLVHLPLARDVAGVVGHLAVLAAGHVALVTGPDAESITARFAPDLRVADERIETLSQHATHLLHPDLALLLSTSGSTGSPKLVRLSRHNLGSNAAAIAQALGLGPKDRAITSLPLHYCYGLSVLHSTLHAGGSVVVTDRSVTDDEFWREHTEQRVTVLAGVPHTFDLIGSRLRDTLPGLRLVTQAGGALAPDRVTELTELGRAKGWQLAVMYGQTEATARMAIHVGDEVALRPDAVGRAVSGSSFRVDRSGHEDRDDGAGELVFTGPGVMLGYAEHPDELALGRMLDELRTGDLGHVDEAGVVRVTGRCDQVAKVLGLRMDLGRVGAALTDAGHRTVVTADPQHLLVTLVIDPAEGSTPHLLRSVRDLAAHASGLQPGAVVVAPVDAIPLLPNGKTDRIACREHALRTLRSHPADGAAGDPLAAAVSVVASSLGRDEVDLDRSFAELGGDSYSLVQTSVRLEQVLGQLPDGWHRVPLRQLALEATPPGRHVRWLDTPLVLRAVAAIAICASHLGLVAVPGGAHTLLALAGWSMSRFTLDTTDPRARRRRGLRSIAALAIPSMAVALVGLVTAGGYGWENVLLVNWLVGEMEWGARINLWFIEALLACSLAVLALLSVPRLGLVHVRHPWAWSMALAAAALVPRWILVPDSTGATRGLPGSVLWLFALGMALGVARTRRQKLATMALTAIGMWDFFVEPSRGLTVFAAIAVLAFVPRIPLPRLLVLPLGLLAAASLHVYLVQWQVFRVVDQPVLALLASFAAGITVWWLLQGPTRALIDRLARLRPTLSTPTGDPS
ncbi:non-ribosomal peptide synthetase [Janibacter limosus]|uniref:AMP-dependent synthetase n=1 Tax=Janibacter limosus TaxID=53458 RepID=A0A4P6MV77_9MICO|nr:non-ribosomal peptide synthetase [Janibacter limosus]QBF46812.1 AMP-dependent synthetase [Janibacter limosus]